MRSNLRASGRGSIAVWFAVIAPVLVLSVLAAIELALVSSSRSKLQASADAAALAAVSRDTPDDAMRDTAISYFEANLTSEERAWVTRLDVSTTTGRVRTSTVQFEAMQPTFSAGVLGRALNRITGVATARAVTQRHIVIDLWLDSSASMGVAADEAGRDRLRQLSANDPGHQSCAFACHLPTPMSDGHLYRTSEQRARAHGVKLRIDVMRESAAIMLRELELARAHGIEPQVAVASLATTWQRSFQPNRDLEAARAYLANFSLAADSASRHSATIVDGAAALPAVAGDGSPGRPERMVVIVTDGMQFHWGWIAPGPINPAACSRIKDRGHRLAVVHIPYVRLDGDGAFDFYVAPVYGRLAPALRACASPGLYFEADEPSQLQETFKRIAAEAIQRPTLTK